MSRSMPRRQQGFTLLEILVVLGILAALTLALTLLVTQVLDARRQLQSARSQGPEPLVDFLQRLDRQLSQLVVRRPHERGQPVGNGFWLQRGGESTLIWVAAGQWSLPWGDHVSRLKTWRLDWDAGQETLTLASSGWLDAAGEVDWVVVDQLTEVSQVNWAFWAQGGWQPVWNDPGLPAGLRLELVWQNETYERWILLPEVAP